MDKLKKSQRVLRTTLTKQVTTLNECLTETELERERIAVVFQLLEDKMAELDSIQCKILDTFMNDQTTSDEDIQKEITAADDYRAKYIQMKFKVRGFLDPPKSNVPVAAAVDPQNSQLSHRLPKLEIPKFSGNTRDWLTFWSQFKKVHNDDIESRLKTNFNTFYKQSSRVHVPTISYTVFLQPVTITLKLLRVWRSVSEGTIYLSKCTYVSCWNSC